MSEHTPFSKRGFFNTPPEIFPFAYFYRRAAIQVDGEISSRRSPFCAGMYER